MKIMKVKFLKACMNKSKKLESKMAHSSITTCCNFPDLWPSTKEEKSIPRDIPRGHLAVYVGENHRRFVIKTALLNLPLFQALLDQSREEYGFTCHSKLYIPCDEKLFIDLVRCATSPQ